MRVPKRFMVSALMTVCTLLAASQDQTAKTQGEVQWVNAKTADPKPCSNGWHAIVDTVGNPVSSPGQEGTTKTPSPGRLSAGIAANPVNPTPTVFVPAVAPEPWDPRYIPFETSFYTIGIYNRWGEQAEKAGKHEEAAGWRTAYQRDAGLNDSEGDILQEIAHDCNCAVNALDEKFSELAGKFRAQIVPGTTMTIPAELIQLHEERKTIVLDHVEQLRVALGETSFKKLEAYVHSMFPEPKPPSTNTTAKSEKEPK